jgi:hypothetical protein
MDSWAEQDVREAKLTRARLEKMSPSAGRRNFAGMLNTLVSESASREMPGLAALEAIRKGQRRHGYKTASVGLALAIASRIVRRQAIRRA